MEENVFDEIVLPDGKRTSLHRKPTLDVIRACSALVKHNSIVALQAAQEDFLRNTPCRTCCTPHCCRMPTTLTQLEAWTIHSLARSCMDHDQLVAKHRDERLWHEAGCNLTAEQSIEICPALNTTTNQCMVYSYRPAVCSTYYAPPDYSPDACRPAFGSSTPMVTGGFLSQMRFSSTGLSAAWLPSAEWMGLSGMATTMLWMDGELPHPYLTYITEESVWLSMDSGCNWTKARE